MERGRDGISCRRREEREQREREREMQTLREAERGTEQQATCECGRGKKSCSGFRLINRCSAAPLTSFFCEIFVALDVLCSEAPPEDRFEASN